MRSQLKRARYYSLVGALVVGLLVRLPGVLWGANFPTGWYGHHIDEYTHLVNAEMLIAPEAPLRWEPHPYPKGMAAHVAVPVVLLREIGIPIYKDPVTPGQIIVTGRLVSVLYGVATILIVFLLASRLTRDRRIPHLAAWLLALGGLHVSQSHYFLSDVPSIFWYLLGTYLLLLEHETGGKPASPLLPLAAASMGVSFGLKLSVIALPTIAIVALLHPPRFFRAIQAGAFFVVGMVLVNVNSYTLSELVNTFRQGTASDTEFIWWSHLLLYLIELPSAISFPLVALSGIGLAVLAKRFWTQRRAQHQWTRWTILYLPLVVYGGFMLFKLDQFPRHLVLLIPWICVLVAWVLAKSIDMANQRGFHASFVVLPVFVYLALFVYDGERVFIDEPRNYAARWLLNNAPQGTEVAWTRHNWLPGYKYVGFPGKARPPVVIMEMHEANHFLSGYGLKDSYPSDRRYIFPAPPEEVVRANQALFRGETEYAEVARFGEGYFMPDYVWVDGLIGNRSRNYVAEVVVYTKRGSGAAYTEK